MSDDMEVRMRNVERTLERIESKLDTALTDISDHEARLRSLEGKGGKRWEAVVTEIIKWAAILAVGYYIGQK